MFLYLWNHLYKKRYILLKYLLEGLGIDVIVKRNTTTTSSSNNISEFGVGDDEDDTTGKTSGIEEKEDTDSNKNKNKKIHPLSLSGK